jgi:hypothetical protein
MKETVKKIWVYLLVGKILFFYLILYFPSGDVQISFNKIIYDVFKSTLLALSTFIGLFTIIYLDSRMRKT